jgi:hypothetical protein
VETIECAFASRGKLLPHAFVMPGLDPGIHRSWNSDLRLDCRVEPGNDETESARYRHSIFFTS